MKKLIQKLRCTFVKHYIRKPAFRLLNVNMPALGISSGILIPNSKFSKKAIYFIFSFFALISILALLFVGGSRKISCIYNGNSAYNCVINTKNVFSQIESKNFPNIISVDIYKNKVHKSRSIIGKVINKVYRYNLSFIDTNGNKHNYTELSLKNSDAQNMAQKLNSEFAKNQSFVSDMGVEWFFDFMLIFAAVLSITILLMFRDTVNNYVFAEVEPGVYKPILRINGVGKLSDAEILSLIKQKNSLGK